MKIIQEPQLGFSSSDFPSVEAEPFLKWAGGKRSLLQSYAPYFPEYDDISRYFEPFLGGGAVFFYLQHPKSFLSDINAELIEVYQVVKSKVEELIAALSSYANEEEFFYKVRSRDPASLDEIDRVARFIYLNKTCYNGLYRVNSKGEFNVPFGRYRNPLICDKEALRAASLALSKAVLRCTDFEDALSICENGDLIYLDPPYNPLTTTANFTSYTSDGFGEDDQVRLADVYRDLDRRGCFLMLSNSDTPLIRKLYKKYRQIEVKAPRAINSNPKKRGKITELLITNF